MNPSRMYQTNAYLKKISANIVKINEKNGKFEIVFHRSNFFPTGGGQPCDQGWIHLSDGSSLRVIDVYDSDSSDEIVHLVDSIGTAEIGQEVELELDWDRRFNNMQRHSGEHVLSGAFYSTCRGANRGFHMGENYVTIDIDLGGAHLTEEQIRETELLANKAIWENLSVRTDWFDNAEQAKDMPARKKIEIEGEVSVVTVGNLSDPFDCVACCGTHVARTGEIGLIKIYKVEINKGMNRVFFDCGRNAFNKIVEESSILRTITDRYSCSSADILHKMDVRDEKESQIRGELAKAAAYVKEAEASRFASAINGSDDSFFRFDTDTLSTDELLKLGFLALEKVESTDRDLLMTVVDSSAKVVLLYGRGKYSAGDMVKKYARNHNGKGGGRPDNARAMFQNLKDIDAFLAEVKASM